MHQYCKSRIFIHHSLHIRRPRQFFLPFFKKTRNPVHISRRMLSDKRINKAAPQAIRLLSLDDLHSSSSSFVNRLIIQNSIPSTANARHSMMTNMTISESATTRATFSRGRIQKPQGEDGYDQKNGNGNQRQQIEQHCIQTIFSLGNLICAHKKHQEKSQVWDDRQQALCFPGNALVHDFSSAYFACHYYKIRNDNCQYVKENPNAVSDAVWQLKCRPPRRCAAGGMV